MNVRRLAVALLLGAGALLAPAIAAAPAGASVSVPPPPGLFCVPIEDETRWVTCEVSAYLGGPFAPPPALRPPAWMICRPYRGPWTWNIWDLDSAATWGCGWSMYSGVILSWPLS